MWRGRLPHWRADDVTYYVTFRHRRELDERERNDLMRQLLRGQTSKIEFNLLCILPDLTEMIFRVHPSAKADFEFADFIEKAKVRAGKSIIQKSGERFPPFYHESFDRILRDDSEYETYWLRILESPVTAELCEDPEEYESLWVADMTHTEGVE